MEDMFEQERMDRENIEAAFKKEESKRQSLECVIAGMQY